MKVKLLKKVRKKYGWYLNTERDPIVINHYKKIVVVYTLDYCKKINNYNDKEFLEKVKIDFCEWQFINAKCEMLKEFGYSMQNQWYKFAKRRLNRKLKKSTI